VRRRVRDGHRVRGRVEQERLRVGRGRAPGKQRRVRRSVRARPDADDVPVGGRPGAGGAEPRSLRDDGRLHGRRGDGRERAAAREGAALPSASSPPGRGPPGEAAWIGRVAAATARRSPAGSLWRHVCLPRRLAADGGARDVNTQGGGPRCPRPGDVAGSVPGTPVGSAP
ncbi:hypothetical protein EG864_15010, partial [Enterococcus faecalis]